MHAERRTKTRLPAATALLQVPGEGEPVEVLQPAHQVSGPPAGDGRLQVGLYLCEDQAVPETPAGLEAEDTQVHQVALSTTLRGLLLLLLLLGNTYNVNNQQHNNTRGCNSIYLLST